MVIESRRLWRPLSGFRTPSKRCVKIVGTSRLPMPNDMADARMKRSRRVKRLYDSTRMPDIATLANRKVVTPPRTGFGTTKAGLSICAELMRMGWRTGQKDTGYLAKDAEQYEEQTTETACCSVRTASDRNHAVILCEDRKGRHGEQGREESANTITLRREGERRSECVVSLNSPTRRPECGCRTPLLQLEREKPLRRR